MEQFRHIGIVLDDEPGDDEALAFGQRLATLSRAESVLCLHVRGLEQAPTGPCPPVEDVRAWVQQHFSPELARKTTIEVHEETGLREVLRSTRDRALDLIVVGRRLPHDGMAAGSQFLRLARKSPCSVMVVPHRAVPHLARALVLMDESEHSRKALETAIAIVQASGEPNPQVLAQSVYSVGYGYRYLGLSFPEAVKNMEEQTRERLSRLIAGVDFAGVAFEQVLTFAPHVAPAAYDLASARNMDFLVLGSRGMSAAPASLLGSVAEKVLAESPLPVLIVKRKGETVRLLNALLDSV